MAIPLIEPAQAASTPVVAGRHRLHGRGVLPGGEGPGRPAAEPVHQRGRRLVGGRLQRMRLVEKARPPPGLINVKPGPETIVIHRRRKPVSRRPACWPGAATSPSSTQGHREERGHLPRGGRQAVLRPRRLRPLRARRHDHAARPGSQSINSGGEKIFPEEVESASRGTRRCSTRRGRRGRRALGPAGDLPGAAPRGRARRPRGLVEHCRTDRRLQGPRGSSWWTVPRHPSGKPDYPAPRPSPRRLSMT